MSKIENPYAKLTGGQWLKGNLHTHTTASDGERPHQVVIDDYASRKYDFLMISDHDIYTSPEDLTCYDARGMVLIPGNEVTANGSHLLHVNASRRIAPSPERQLVLTEAAENDPSSFVIINHPNWQGTFDHTPMKDLEKWTGYAGIEIFNGTVGRLEGSPYATNKWDMLLSHGRRVWGFANDDHHLAVGDAGLGWNMVYARTKTLPDIMDALRHGRFYASTGVTIRDMSVTGTRIRIETENAERIVALQENGQRFTLADSHKIEVEVPSGAKHVRFECWGKGESFAWTQPFFVTAS